MSVVGARKHSLEDFFDLLPALRSKFEDYPACLRKTAFCARFATLRNQLDRIALQCDMKINQTGPITTALGQPAGIAWRLSSECFAVVVSAVPIEGYSLPPGTTPPQDDLASVSAVHFEFNQEKPVLCEELVDELRKRNYNALLAHITNLLALYNVPGDRSHRCRAFLCLRVLEEDLAVLSAAASTDSGGGAVNPPPVNLSPRTASEVATLVQSINFSAIGQIEPRAGGRFAALTYFVSPAQEAIAKSSIVKRTSSPTSLRGLLKGFFAFVGLRATTDKIQHNLPFIPLVNLQKDESGLNIAQFATADSIKCGPIAAEFVLFLHPPLILTAEATADVEKITGIPLVSSDNCPPEPVHSLILRRHNQEALRLVDVHMSLPNRSQHVYHLRPEHSNKLQGYCVTEIAFTSPSQLPALISLLRRNAAWLSFVESFVLHPKKPVSKDEALSFKFDVSMSSVDELCVAFPHPCALERKVQVYICLGNLGVKSARVSGCNLAEQLEGSTVTPPDPTRVLARSHNLPVALTWLLILLGCPVNRSLSCLFPATTSVTGSTCTSTAVTSTAAPSDAERHFRATCLGRARRALQFSDDCDADGLLSGADQISQENLQHLDLLTQPPPPSPTQFDVFVTSVSSSVAACVSSLSLPGVDAFRPVGSPTATATAVPVGGSAVLRSSAFLASAPLPPGVLVTTPPSCLLDGGGAVKPMSIEETVTSTPGCFPPPPLVGTGSGGLGSRSGLTFTTPLIPGTVSASAAMFASPPTTASASPSPLKTPSFSTSVPTPQLGSRQSCPTTTSSSAASNVSAAGSMLVSLLDEDIPSQTVHLPTLNAATLQPSRVISSMLPQTQLPQQQTSVHKPSGSDVLNHLLTSGQSEKDSALLRSKNKATVMSTVSSPSSKANLSGISSRGVPSAIGSIASGIGSAYSGQTFTTTTAKRQRKRREASPVAAVEPIQFISVLPTRSSVAEATFAGKQSRFSVETTSASLSTPTTEGGKVMTNATATSVASAVASSEKHKSGRPSSGSSGGGGGGGGVSQPLRHTPSSSSSLSYAGTTSSLVSKSVYDFEDVPMAVSSTTSLSKQPSSSSSSVGAISSSMGASVPTTNNGNAATNYASMAATTVATTKSELRITIRPNWTAASSTSVGGSGPNSGIPNTSTTSAKPRVVVDGKPSSFLKQMLHSSPATSSSDTPVDRTPLSSFMAGVAKPKKERKRRASSKSSKSLPLLSAAVVSSTSEISPSPNRKVWMGATSTVSTVAMTGTATVSSKPSHGLTASLSGPLTTAFSSTKAATVKNRKKVSSMSSYSSSVIFSPSEPALATATSVATLKPTSTSGGPTKKMKLSSDDATRSLEMVEPTISATSKGNGLMKGYKIPKKKASSPVQPNPQASAPTTTQQPTRMSPSMASELDSVEAIHQSSPSAPPLRDQTPASETDTDILQPKPAPLLSVAETASTSTDSAWTAMSEIPTQQQRLPFPQSSGSQAQVSRKLPKNLTDIVEQLRAKSTREHTHPGGCSGNGSIPGSEEGSGWQQSEISASASLEMAGVREGEVEEEKEAEEEEGEKDKNKKRTTDVATDETGKQSRPGCTTSPPLGSEDTPNVSGSDNIFEKLGSSSATTAKGATTATAHRQQAASGAGRVSVSEDQSSNVAEGSRSRSGSISQDLAFDATVASTETSGETGAKLVKAFTDTPDSPTEDVPSKVCVGTSSKIIPVSPTSASRRTPTVASSCSSGGGTGSGSNNLPAVHAFHEKTIRPQPPPPPPPINLPARGSANPGGGPRFGPGYQRGSWTNRHFNSNRPPSASFPGHAWGGPRRLPGYRGPDPGPGAPVGLGTTGNWGMHPQGGMFRGHFPGPGGPPAPSFVGGPSSLGPMNRTPTKK